MRKSASSFEFRVSSKCGRNFRQAAGSWELGAGFTLVETLIVIFIFILTMLALMNMFLGYATLFNRQEAAIAATASASMIMSEVQSATLQADHVVASRALNGTTYSSDASTLVLELPAINSSGNIISGVYDYVAFYASGTSMYRIISPGTGSVRLSGTKQLSSALNALTFTYDDGDFTKVTAATIDVTTQTLVKGIPTGIHVRQAVHLRNF